jgi:hypothetical protein
MVDRAPPVVGRSGVHVALGASPTDVLGGSFESRFGTVSSQPMHLAFPVLLVLAVGLSGGVAQAQQPPDSC